MSHYTRGATFERKVKKYYEDQGWFCVRAAGSHGVADVVAIRREKRNDWRSLVHLVSCRTNGKWSGQELNELSSVAREISAVPMIALRDQKRLVIRVHPSWETR